MRKLKSRTALVAVCLTTLCWTSTVAAQSSGTTPAPEQPQQAPTEPEPSTGIIAKTRRYIEEKRLLERFVGDDDGLYLRIGGMTTGSGLALGPGYRTHLLDDYVFVDVSAALSTKMYKAVDAEVRWLQLLDERVELWTGFRYQDFPQEDYFGLGGATSLATRTNYALESTDVFFRGLVKPTRWLRVGADIGWFRPTIGPGTDDNYLSIEERFDDVDAPGLADQPTFVHNTVFAEVDYRDRAGSPGKGGLYRASFGTWEDVTLDAFDFHRFDAEAAQFHSVFPRHVVGVHVGISYVNNEQGHRVPFYFLPYVGGSDTVRGFREFRFRDENILYVNGEYRWQALRPLDIALFFDAGEVRADWQDIDLNDLKTSYGFGIRVHTESRTFLRLDVGTGGREGRRIFFKLGPSF